MHTTLTIWLAFFFFLLSFGIFRELFGFFLVLVSILY